MLSRIHLHCTRRFIRTTVARRGYALTEKYRKTDLLKQQDTFNYRGPLSWVKTFDPFWTISLIIRDYSLNNNNCFAYFKV